MSRRTAVATTRIIAAIATIAAVAPIGCGSEVATFDDSSVTAAASMSADPVWFTPNIGSIDLRDLFTRPEQWPAARSKIDVFQFYGVQMLATQQSQCTTCGPNLRPALEVVGAVRKLDGWGIKIAAEIGGVKHHSCTAAEALGGARAVIRSVADQGGQIAYLALDEPYIGGEMMVNGESCNFCKERSAQETADLISALNVEYPEVRVGDIEPFPYFSAYELERWIDIVQEHGVHLDFFHLDVDLNAIKGDDVSGDLRDLESFCEARGVPFGVILIGNEYEMNRSGSAPRKYYDTVMDWSRKVQRAVGMPQQLIVQSWVAHNDGSKKIPQNLPENSGSVYSHTRIVNEIWSLFANNDAIFVSQRVPNEVAAGAHFTAEVTMHNGGNTTWTWSAGFKLGSQMPQDNSTWGTGRVPVADGRTVPPSTDHTFVMNLRAPSSAGPHRFAWRMVHEGVEWFGTASTTRTIQVLNAAPPPDAGSDPAPPPPPPDPTDDPNATPSEIKVTHGYRGILGREPDSGGLAGYASLLDGGGSTVQLCDALFDSAEFTSNRGHLSSEELGGELYRGILEREADPGGLVSTVEEINAGRGGVRAAAMIESAEFADEFL